MEEKILIEGIKPNSTQIPTTDKSYQALDEWFQENLVSKFEENSEKENNSKLNEDVEEKSPIKLSDEQMECLDVSIDSTTSLVFTNSQLDFIASINETALLDKKLDVAERELDKVIENIQLTKELKKTVSCSQVLEKIIEENSESKQVLDKFEIIESKNKVDTLSYNNESIVFNQTKNEKPTIPTDSSKIEHSINSEMIASCSSFENPIIMSRKSLEESTLTAINFSPENVTNDKDKFISCSASRFKSEENGKNDDLKCLVSSCENGLKNEKKTQKEDENTKVRDFLRQPLNLLISKILQIEITNDIKDLVYLFVLDMKFLNRKIKVP